MKFTFAIFKEGEYLKTLEIERSPIVFGRNTECDVQLDSRTVSRQHCEIKLKRAGLTIKDLGSRNGTVVNGKAIKPGKRVLLQSADIFEIGKFSIRVQIIGAENSQAELVAKSEGEPADQNDLLTNLEAFIRNHIAAEIPVEVDDSDVVTQNTVEHRVGWAATKSAGDIKNASSEAANDKKSQPDDSTQNDETVGLTQVIEPENTAESRRLEMRRRIDSMKAKDSKEAADRALKKLFGG